MRCFLAAWPNTATREALAALSADIARRVEHRRVVRADDLHLTLAFIGELDDTNAIALSQNTNALRFTPFDWQLDTIGFFERAGVVWAGGETVTPLLELAEKLRNTLDRLNVRHDARALVPHVTLLRGAQSTAEELITPIVWRIDSVALYRSTGSRSHSIYQQVRY